MTPETPHTLLALGVSKPVYDCRWPTTRRAVEDLWASRPHHLTDAPYEGTLDDLHERLVERWRAWARPVVAIPDEFRYAYATHGSTEALRESLAQWVVAARTRHQQPVLHVFHGEYEGYAAQAEGYGARVVRHDRDDYADTLAATVSPGDRVYLSQPSAIDGNVWDGFDGFLRHVADLHPALRITVDLTYVGLVGGAFRVALESPAVDEVVFSLSKPLGCYAHRIGGAFSRAPLPNLWGNRWFRNPFSIALGLELLDHTGDPYALPREYRALQEEVTEALGRRIGLPVTPSDAVLLATSPADDAAVTGDIRLLARGAPGRERLRFCLTPSFDARLARSPEVR